MESLGIIYSICKKIGIKSYQSLQIFSDSKSETGRTGTDYWWLAQFAERFGEPSRHDLTTVMIWFFILQNVSGSLLYHLRGPN